MILIQNHNEIMSDPNTLLQKYNNSYLLINLTVVWKEDSLFNLLGEITLLLLSMYMIPMESWQNPLKTDMLVK